jgi:hypothetical protein
MSVAIRTQPQKSIIAALLFSSCFFLFLPFRFCLAESGALKANELGDAGGGEVEQRRHLHASERRTLGGALDLDEVAGPVMTTFMSVSHDESST